MKKAQLFETTRYYFDCPNCEEYLEIETITEFAYCSCGQKIQLIPPNQ